MLGRVLEKIEQGLRYYRYLGLRDTTERMISPLPQSEFKPFPFPKLTESERRAYCERETTLSRTPKISVLMPVCDPPKEFLKRAIDSVLHQTYSHLELCIADDNSTNTEIKSVLQEYERQRENVRCVYRTERGHIAAATNSAAEMASGEIFLVLDHDDLLEESALFEVARAFSLEPRADVVYSDEFLIDTADWVQSVAAKPSFSPFYLRHFMYVGHLCAFRRERFEEVGRFQSESAGSQDYNLLLRLLLSGSRFAHIPKSLYGWRIHSDSVASNPRRKRYALTNAKAALQAVCRSLPLEVTESIYPGVYEYALTADPVYEEISFRDEMLSLALQKVRTSSAPFIILRHEEVVLSPATRKRLLAEATLPGLGMVSAVLTAQGRVVEAGYMLKKERVIRNFFLESTSSAGVGVRLWAGFDTRACSCKAVVVIRDVAERVLKEMTTFESERSLEIFLASGVRSCGRIVACSGLARGDWKGRLPLPIENLPPADWLALVKQFPELQEPEPFHPPLSEKFGFQS